MAEIDNDTIMNLLFDSSKGPLENVLSLVEKGFMFLGWWNMAAVTAAKLMGYSLSELGAYLDKTLGLKNAKDLSGVDDERLAELDKEASARIPMSIKIAEETSDSLRAMAIFNGERYNSKQRWKNPKKESKLSDLTDFIAAKFNLRSGLWGLLAYRGIEEMKRLTHSDDSKTSSQKSEVVSEIDKKTNSKRKILEKNLQQALSGS
jgi:hypothetical protein